MNRPRLTAEAAIRAILARIQGEWDQPDLVAFGPLSPNTTADVAEIAHCVDADD